MKRLGFCLLAICGVMLLTGCDDVKRKVMQQVEANKQRAIDKTIEASQEKIDSGIESTTKKKDDKESKDRNALKGGKDDPEE